MRRTHSTNLLDNKKSCAFFFLREIFGYIASGFPVYSSIAPFKLSVYNRLNFFKNTSLVMLWHPLTIHCIEIDTISTKMEEKTHFRNTTGSVTKAYVLSLLSEHFDQTRTCTQYVDQKRVLSGRLNAGHDNVCVLVDGYEGAVDVGVAGPLPVQGQTKQTTTTTTTSTPHHHRVIAL